MSIPPARYPAILSTAHTRLPNDEHTHSTARAQQYTHACRMTSAPAEEHTPSTAHMPACPLHFLVDRWVRLLSRCHPRVLASEFSIPHFQPPYVTPSSKFGSGFIQVENKADPTQWPPYLKNQMYAIGKRREPKAYNLVNVGEGTLCRVISTGSRGKTTSVQPAPQF